VDADARVQKAVAHLQQQVETYGWRCSAAPELGNFKGPGRRADACPIANVYALKVQSLREEWAHSAASRCGTEALLWHWAQQGERKLLLFGIGTDFRKLKYPFVWYDILHIVDVLSRFPQTHTDPRFQEMVATLVAQADEHGRYAATSLYRAWQGWSFADKKRASPWLTLLVKRIAKRIAPAQRHAPQTNQMAETSRP